MASERSGELADDFARANAEALEFARSCTDEQWSLTVPGEGWAVGVVLHHIAEGHAHGVRWLGEMAGGQGVSDTAEAIDKENAAHAVRAESAARDETVALLRVNGSQLEEVLRGLSDEELERAAPFGPAGGRSLPTEDLAAVSARHTREHLSHAHGAVRGDY
jgi:uncharacterized damage-inducible protein DinB